MDANRWRHVEELCDGALKLTAGERPAYLDRACGTDTSLRREVDALLAHEATAERFLSSPAAKVARDAQAPAASLIGRRFGDYEIIAKLGEGGMGEVYRARDLTLGRDVAIKMLPGAFAGDRERLRRFVREARLLATVNHPFIGAIYGLVDIEGIPALVLELVDGETLSAALARKAMAVPRALTIAAQIADALDHAHRRGITHLDLKPANIMLTRDGVKLLDFGVGKWTPAASEATMTKPSTLTGEGAIVGTLHYMSPEQLEGRAADARSDIFSFGAVLFEMLAGRKAFDGPSQASVIAAVMGAPAPKLPDVHGVATPSLERIIAKCLAKDPDERWQSARDLRDALGWVKTDNDASPAVAPVRRSRRAISIAAGAAGVVLLALVGWAASNWRTEPSNSPAAPIRFSEQTQDARFSSTANLLDSGTFDISNDGQLLYASTKPGLGTLLHVRRLDRLDTFALPGTGGALVPVFSPDGEWTAFLTSGAPTSVRKMRVGAEATPEIVLSDASPAFEIAWSTADTILIAGLRAPIRRVPANGGLPEAITTIQDGEIDHHGPVLLPSGNGLLFSVHGQRNRFSIAVQDLRSGARKMLIESGFAPAYSPTGHLVFGRGSTIMAVPFDERSLTINGDAVTLVDRVSTLPREGQAHYRLSKNGTLVYRPRRSIDGRRLIWVDRAGRETPVGISPRAFHMPSVSPDGKQIAFVVGEDDRRDIWTYSLNGGALARLTEGGNNWGPLWTGDGNSVIYARDGGSESQVVLHRPDGTAEEVLAADINDVWPVAMTKDEEQTVLMIEPPTSEFYLAQAGRGSRQLQTVIKTPGAPRQARLSTDGRWLAFTESTAGRTEVFVQSYPEPGVRRQVSVDGGNHALWSRDGRELFYQFAGRMFAVTIDTTHGLKWGQPRILFERRFVLNWGFDYDIAPDGRFLVVSPAPAEGEDKKLEVVVNWRNELLSRVPVPR
jgi:serine/threonine-protein kinase